MKRFAVVVLVLALLGAGAMAAWRYVEDRPQSLPPDACAARVGSLTAELDPEQSQNAALIVALAVRRGLPARAATIALATAMQESKLYNIEFGDRDSIGLFQQRPSMGWGTREQILDPVYSTTQFYDHLVRIDGYEGMRITEAAQRVQRSGFPEAYAQHEPEARALASALTGHSPYAFSCSYGSVGAGDAAVLRAEVSDVFEPTVSGVTVRGRSVTIGVRGTRGGWALAQYLVAHAQRLGLARVSYGHRSWTAGADSADGWVRAGGSVRGQVSVELEVPANR